MAKSNGGERGAQRENPADLQRMPSEIQFSTDGCICWGNYSSLGKEETVLKADLRPGVVCLFQIVKVENIKIHWAFGRV